MIIKLKQRYITGFTLAEVLIVLVVTGIIGSLTIPSLIQSIEEKDWKIRYRKAFAIASQSWNSARSDYLITARTGWVDNSANSANFTAFASKYNVVKQCFSNNNSECWETSGDKYWSGFPNNTASAFIDSSGMVWSRSCSTCGAEILVDTNGSKRPNQYGKDRFVILTLVSKGTVTNPDTDIAGLPIYILPRVDYSGVNANNCPLGGCYYTSWLRQ